MLHINIDLPYFSKQEEQWQTIYFALLSDDKFVQVMIGKHASYLHNSIPSALDKAKAISATTISREDFLEAILQFTERIEQNFDELKQQVTH